jgi:hypothetical protein
VPRFHFHLLSISLHNAMFRALLLLSCLATLMSPALAAEAPKTMPRAKVIGWLETE